MSYSEFRTECYVCDTEHGSDIGCVEALQFIITKLKEQLKDADEDVKRLMVIINYMNKEKEKE